MPLPPAADRVSLPPPPVTVTSVPPVTASRSLSRPPAGEDRVAVVGGGRACPRRRRRSWPRETSSLEASRSLPAAAEEGDRLVPPLALSVSLPLPPIIEHVVAVGRGQRVVAAAAEQRDAAAACWRPACRCRCRRPSSRCWSWLEVSESLPVPPNRVTLVPLLDGERVVAAAADQGTRCCRRTECERVVAAAAEQGDRLVPPLLVSVALPLPPTIDDVGAVGRADSESLPLPPNSVMLVPPLAVSVSLPLPPNIVIAGCRRCRGAVVAAAAEQGDAGAADWRPGWRCRCRRPSMTLVPADEVSDVVAAAAEHGDAAAAAGGQRGVAAAADHGDAGAGGRGQRVVAAAAEQRDRRAAAVAETLVLPLPPTCCCMAETLLAVSVSLPLPPNIVTLEPPDALERVALPLPPNSVTLEPADEVRVSLPVPPTAVTPRCRRRLRSACRCRCRPAMDDAAVAPDEPGASRCRCRRTW